MSTEAAPTATGSGDRTQRFDPGARWRVHPSVAVRPEPFGALLYHFGTRRLTFLKDRRLLEAVTALPDQPTALAACRSAGIDPDEQPRYDAALQRLVDIQMLVRDDTEDPTT